MGRTHDFNVSTDSTCCNYRVVQDIGVVGKTRYDLKTFYFYDSLIVLPPAVSFCLNTTQDIDKLICW